MADKDTNQSTDNDQATEEQTQQQTEQQAQQQAEQQQQQRNLYQVGRLMISSARPLTNRELSQYEANSMGSDAALEDYFRQAQSLFNARSAEGKQATIDKDIEVALDKNGKKEVLFNANGKNDLGPANSNSKNQGQQQTQQPSQQQTQNQPTQQGSGQQQQPQQQNSNQQQPTQQNSAQQQSQQQQTQQKQKQQPQKQQSKKPKEQQHQNLYQIGHLMVSTARPLTVAELRQFNSISHGSDAELENYFRMSQAFFNARPDKEKKAASGIKVYLNKNGKKEVMYSTDGKNDLTPTNSKSKSQEQQDSPVQEDEGKEVNPKDNAKGSEQHSRYFKNLSRSDKVRDKALKALNRKTLGGAFEASGLLLTYGFMRSNELMTDKYRLGVHKVAETGKHVLVGSYHVVKGTFAKGYHTLTKGAGHVVHGVSKNIHGISKSAYGFDHRIEKRLRKAKKMVISGVKNAPSGFINIVSSAISGYSPSVATKPKSEWNAYDRTAAKIVHDRKVLMKVPAEGFKMVFTHEGREKIKNGLKKGVNATYKKLGGQQQQKPKPTPAKESGPAM